MEATVSEGSVTSKIILCPEELEIPISFCCAYAHVMDKIADVATSSTISDR